MPYEVSLFGLRRSPGRETLQTFTLGTCQQKLRFSSIFNSTIKRR